MRENIDRFSINRLERVYHGGNFTSLLERLAPDFPVTIKKESEAIESLERALQETYELCGKQILQKEGSCEDIYLVISFNYVNREDSNQDVIIPILQKALKYHPNSFDLNFDVTTHSLIAMMGAKQTERWDEVQRYASLVLTYSERTKGINFKKWHDKSMSSTIRKVESIKRKADTLFRA